MHHLAQRLHTVEHAGSVSALDRNILFCHLQYVLLAFQRLIQSQYNGTGLFSSRNTVSHLILHSGFLLDSLLQHFRIRIPISQQSALKYDSAVIAKCMFPRQEFYLFRLW